MSKEKIKKIVLIILTVVLGLLSVAGIIFGYWHIIANNGIIEPLHQISGDEGWFRWAIVKGGLEWGLGGAGIYFMIAPLLFILFLFMFKGNLLACFGMVLLGAVAMAGLSAIPGILFNTMSFFMQEFVVLGLIFGLFGILALIPTGGTIVVFVLQGVSGVVSSFKK